MGSYDKSIVSTIVAMSKTMGMITVAEGIEAEEIQEFCAKKVVMFFRVIFIANQLIVLNFISLLKIGMRSKKGFL